MSETTEITRPTLENFNVRTTTRDFSGRTVEVLHVGYGEPMRTLEVQALSLGEQWDLAELTGPNASNGVWVNMATMAASVRAIEGVPIPAVPHSRDSIKRTLEKLDVIGLQAVMMALNGYRGAGPAIVAPQQSNADFKSAVGN